MASLRRNLFVVLGGDTAFLPSTKLMYHKIINNLVYAKNRRHHKEHHRFAITIFSAYQSAYHYPISSQQRTHNEPKKNSTHLPKPLLVSAGISAIVIPRRHMAVIIKAKKQAYKMVCSPWGGLVDGRPTPTITT